MLQLEFYIGFIQVVLVVIVLLIIIVIVLGRRLKKTLYPITTIFVEYDGDLRQVYEGTYANKTIVWEEDGEKKEATTITAPKRRTGTWGKKYRDFHIQDGDKETTNAIGALETKLDPTASDLIAKRRKAARSIDSLMEKLGRMNKMVMLVTFVAGVGVGLSVALVWFVNLMTESGIAIGG